MHPITFALSPDSCICQNCFRNYYRNPTKPWWYRKHEEFIFESGEQLEIGAELDIHTEPEGACEGQGREEIPQQNTNMNTDLDSTENYDTEGSDVIENEPDRGIDNWQIKSVIDHALVQL